jgi:hypothetical protein
MGRFDESTVLLIKGAGFALLVAAVMALPAFAQPFQRSQAEIRAFNSQALSPGSSPIAQSRRFF